MRHIAERLVRALMLAETIPFVEWQKGGVDRAQLRELTKDAKGLEQRFDVLASWVTALLRDETCTECDAVVLGGLRFNGRLYCSDGCRDEAKDAYQDAIIMNPNLGEP